jgi:hypothetical protein
VTERPILFSAPMVRAILDGRKTQTRRVVKAPIPTDADEVFHWSGEEYRRLGATNVAETGLWARRNAGPAGWLRFIAPCPYGVPGDRLWVRETWKAQEAFDQLSPLEIGQQFADELGDAACCPVQYVVDGRLEGSVALWQQSPPGKTRVSIHMPRWASRITLQITDVRVERLNEISIEDAKAEGLSWVSPTFGVLGIAESWSQNPVDAYARLWEHINGPGSWAANPWVWAVTFERVNS